MIPSQQRTSSAVATDTVFWNIATIGSGMYILRSVQVSQTISDLRDSAYLVVLKKLTSCGNVSLGENFEKQLQYPRVPPNR